MGSGWQVRVRVTGASALARGRVSCTRSPGQWEGLLSNVAAGALRQAMCPSPWLGPFVTLEVTGLGERGRVRAASARVLAVPCAWSVFTWVPGGYTLFPQLLWEA